MKNPYQRRASAKSTLSQVQTSAKDTYLQFLNKICHQACVYSLYKNGWAISTLVSGERAFPLWQSESLVRLVLKGQWHDFEIRQISFLELTERVIPFLRQQKINAALDLTADGKYMPTTAQDFMLDLKKYLYLLQKQEPTLFTNNFLPQPRKLRLNF